jgi:hypothetical protein
MPVFAKPVKPLWFGKLPLYVAAIYILVNTPLLVYALFYRQSLWVTRLLDILSPGARWLSYETNNLFYGPFNQWIFHDADYKWRYYGAILIPAAIYGLIMYWLGSWLIVKGITFWQQRK